MNISLYTQPIKAFVADVSNDMLAKHEKLCTVLSRARIEPICVPKDADNITIEQLIKSCNCSIHILGNQDIFSSGSTRAGEQYFIAKKMRFEGFKLFLWNPAGKVGRDNSYINTIRREIVENTVYSSKSSPIVFVEELRGIMSVRTTTLQRVEKTDVFFIYNDLDSDTATDILSMVEDVLTVTKLPITMSVDTDYTEYVKNQLHGSKIGVVYYNYAGDWAVSFARQVWKDSGGKSGKTPLMLVGNIEHAKESDAKVLNGIIETYVSDVSLIPLDIKVFYDKNVENKVNK